MKELNKDIYTGFSNYSEINLAERCRKSVSDADAWGIDNERFIRYRSEWKQAAETEYLSSCPLHVDIELADICNLRCTICVHGISDKKIGGFMDEDLARHLIEESSKIGVYSLKFNWRGEVSLNPFLVEAVAYAKELGILEVQINTNGLPKDRNIFIACAEKGIDRIIFSVDGFSRDTYEKVRLGGDYGVLLANIDALLEWKKRNRVKKPLVRVQMVRTKINFQEVEGFLSYWRNLVDDVRISDVMDRGQGGCLGVGDQIAVGRRRCPQPFQRLTVGRDGRVSPCCVDWNQDFVVGDTKKQGLLDIWNSPKMLKIRDVQRTCLHNTISICKTCYVKESYVWELRNKGQVL